MEMSSPHLPGTSVLTVRQADGTLALHQLDVEISDSERERDDAIIQAAHTRDGLNLHRAAAELRAAGSSIARTYAACMAAALGDPATTGEAFEVTDQAVRTAVERAFQPTSVAVALQASGGRPTRFTAAELVTMDIPPPVWVVEGVIPQGVTLLAGKPKFGKSFLALGISMALASGGTALGRVDIAQPRDVLYLFLEGGMAGLRKRLLDMSHGNAADVPERLAFATDWPKGEAALDALRGYFEANPSCRFLVIDTLYHFRQSAETGKSLFNEDYNATSEITKICTWYGVSALIVHHASKKSAESTDDVLDLISGSTGLAAGVDSGAVLTNTSSGAVLAVRPRDLEEVQLALNRDLKTGLWTIEGDAGDRAASEMQRKILSIIRESHDPLRAHEIAQIAGIENQGTVRQQLHRMVNKTPPLVSKQGQCWVLASPTLGQQAAAEAATDGATDEPATEGDGDVPF